MFKDNAEADQKKCWKKVRQTVREDSSSEFPLLLQIVDRVDVLPHSSAASERIFSQINLNKTKLSNKLDNAALSGILYSKSLIKKSNGISNVDCKPLVKMMTNYMYNYK